MNGAKQYLTNDQVLSLNERHGWFQYGDAQSDVSRAFAQDAIAMHEQMRQAAPDLYAALEPFTEHCSSDETITITVRTADVRRARAALSRASGAASEGA